MNTITYFISDVFCSKSYSGNQLATFINCGGISSNEMQKIASILNFPETTFVLSDQEIDGGYEVRIFTPKAEVDFAGHPTLGTALIIQKYIIKDEVKQVKLNLKVGQITVSFNDGDLWMEQIEPKFGVAMEADFLAKVLSISPKDIDHSFPIVEITTGLPFTIVPLKNKKKLGEVSIDKKKYENFITQTWAKGILTFAPGGHENDQSLAVRVFVPYLGIDEDPATGSANGCLAAYLVRYNYFGSDNVDIRVGQGYEMGRNSQLSMKANKERDQIRIFIGGKVIVNAQGSWFLKHL